MKKASYVFHLLCVLGIFVLSSCGFDEITAPAPTDTMNCTKLCGQYKNHPYGRKY